MARLSSSVARLLCATSISLAGCGDRPQTGGQEASDSDAPGSETDATGTDTSGSVAPTEATSAPPDSEGGSGSHGEDSSPGGSGTTGEPPPPVCGDGKLDPGEACDDGDDDPFDGCLADCTAVAPIDAPPLEWKYFEVPGTMCMNGSTAGFGVSLNPASKNVMIYLEGGGACFNDACDFSAFNIPFIPPPDGIFNRNNPVNPVRDWSMIYVPYCTGDIHGGDKDTTLGGQVRHFRGYTNITKYLQQWVPTFPGAEKVLLTGISAGGFGAGLNAAQVADAFGPGPQMIVIDDSGPPVSNQVIPPCLQQTFREVWGLDQTILAACGPDCADPDDFATGILQHTLTAYPGIRFGLFSNTADAIIRGFMSFGWGNGQYNTCEGLPISVPAEVYEDGLLSLRADHEDAAATYYIGQTQVLYNFGQGHTVLRSPSFWTTVIDGVQLAEWVGKVIDGEVTHVGP
ncbi:pectin acetylesterase-family hydrolase [Nannocystis pusilla]|uniref:pectin acetylesterase-family hydrolase n=1 Tax=Nannocystis pusilla TaxID=889268 RepID=UPI003BF3E200